MVPIREEIARKAYELYVARDRQNGGDVDDWLTAEKELQGQLSRRPGRPILEGKVQELPTMLSEDSSQNSTPESIGSFRRPRHFLAFNP
jgi:hypothetical protein